MDLAALLDQALDFEEQGRLDEALLRFEDILVLDPGNSVARAGAITAKASHACDERRHADAISLCNEVLSTSSYDLRALTVRARANGGLGRHDEALADIQRVLSFAPEFPEALAVRGVIRAALGETASGAHDLETAAVLRPNLAFLQGQALQLSMQMCSWDGFQEKLERLLKAVADGQPAALPFWLLSLPSAPRQQLQAAATYFKRTIKSAPTPLPAQPLIDKIRIAYVSVDFCAHATSHLVAGLFEAHDRAKFEVIALAVGGNAFDPMRQQITKAVDRLIDCAERSDAEIADLSRHQGLHIALDLNVYTARQPGIFARRIAPVQVNYLGYPGTAAAPCYDYIIGDPVLTPLVHQPNFSEHIVQLPHCYQPNALARYGALKAPRRSDVGLPENAFVFCCFNDGFKILPDVFEVWMRLLRGVDGSVLWLLQNSPIAAKNLQAEAAKRGVAPERLVFAPRVPIGQHLARYAAADLFLDTFPYNAHTTATDALWAGLPLLTCEGDTFASRVAASALTAAGVPELITHSLGEYEHLASTLAHDPVQLAGIRARLRSGRDTAPLFDTVRYTRNIESAYQQMWARHQAGLSPHAFTVTEGAVHERGIVTP